MEREISSIAMHQRQSLSMMSSNPHQSLDNEHYQVNVVDKDKDDISMGKTSKWKSPDQNARTI